MSVQKFEAVLEAGKYSRDERSWFVKWIRRFREFLYENELLPVDVDKAIVIRFLQQVKTQGMKSLCLSVRKHSIEAIIWKRIAMSTGRLSDKQNTSNFICPCWSA